jgi:hypothetical protein
MAWEPVPLDVYGTPLAVGIRSSWVSAWPTAPRPDLLLVPGRQGTRKELRNPALID